MEMKRTSFVCFGAQGNKDSLVYQEIPGRDGGEEFFLFFSPGNAAQEPLMRALFREAVSTSRLGAPEHYFARFIEQFSALTGTAGADGDVIGDALIMIQIRRGDEVHLLCNRDASLVHWKGGPGWHNPVESLQGFSEIRLGSSHDQRDLFHRAPEDTLVLYRFTLGSGEHTLILAPSNDFVERHAESLRNSVFFPSFEFPREVGIELAVARSFPALHWRDGEREEATAAPERAVARARRLNVPLIAGAIAASAAVVLFFGPLLRHRESEKPRETHALLGAADVSKPDSTALAGTRRSGVRDATSAAVQDDAARLALAEAWRRQFGAAVTSSPRCYGGKIYFGCRDGFLYAFSSDGSLAWKYRSGAGIGASPCCVQGRVICANYRGDLFCLDANTGTVVWSLATGSKIVSSPQAGRDIIVVGTTDGRLVAVRPRDGGRLWEKKLGAAIWANPAVGSDCIVAATKDGALAKLDFRGKIVWKAHPGGGIFSSPLCIEEKGIVVFGTDDGFVNGYVLSSGARAWRFAAGSAVDGSPSRGENAIYIGAGNGKLHALSFDGTPLWQCAVGGAVRSKPAIIGSSVFVTTYGSRLVAVDAATGRPLGEFRAASPVYSSPESDGERIYFGSNVGVFHAVAIRAPVAS
jgi:outer membrane protein assembly factor BamB